MLAHLLAGALLLRCCCRGEHFEYGCRRGDALACLGEKEGAMLVLGYLAVDLARMGAGVSSVGATLELLFEFRAFLF